MNYRYANVNQHLVGYVRTVLILDDGPLDRRYKLPLVTSGTSVLLCRTHKSAIGTEDIVQLSLFGMPVPVEQWLIEKNQTLLAYFFKPFMMPALVLPKKFGM